MLLHGKLRQCGEHWWFVTFRSILSTGCISMACCEPSPTTASTPSSPCPQTSSSWSLTPSSGLSGILSAILLRQVMWPGPPLPACQFPVICLAWRLFAWPVTCLYLCCIGGIKLVWLLAVTLLVCTLLGISLSDLGCVYPRLHCAFITQQSQSYFRPDAGFCLHCHAGLVMG